MTQQHDLDRKIAEDMVQKSAIVPGDYVLEVGPGLGSLTAPLLAAGACVVAVEIDPIRVQALRERFPQQCKNGQLLLHCADARGWMPQVERPWRVLANPPFVHSAELLHSWLLHPPGDQLPWALDLLLQREVAEKLCAGQGSWTRSSVLWQLAGKAQIVDHLRRSDFSPRARVDCSWWSWRCHSEHPSPQRLRQVDYLLRQSFRGDHSTRQALRGLTTRAILARQAQQQSWDPDSHPRSVPPSAWLSLADFLASIGKIPTESAHSPSPAQASPKKSRHYSR